MNNPDEVVTQATKRGESAQLPYAGAVTPQEAFLLLKSHPQAKLIDVRTQAERDWVGRVILPESQHSAVQWNLYPGGKNPDFMQQLEQVARPDDVLLFLCRSGVRSHHAAEQASAHGYAHCFNILEGFEGEKDADGHRKTKSGWCHAGLPWLGA